MKRRVLCSVALCLAVAVGLTAGAGPSWWRESARPVIAPGAATNDFAAVNLGQLKWFATNAFREVEERLPGGMAAGLSQRASAFQGGSSDFAVANLGQLKQVATNVWGFLIAAGYATNTPWTTATADDQDYAAANIGQLKHVFDFDLRGDLDADDMADLWEQHYLGGTNALATADADGDGFLNVYEFVHRSDPTNAAVVPGFSTTDTYVSLSGSHTAPFSSWSTAATNIQSALDAATNDYAIVWVSDGTYTGSGNRDIEFPARPVMLVSTGGMDACVVDCQGLERGFVFANGQPAATVLAGLTVSNGVTAAAGGGVYCSNASPWIANCRLVDCAATAGGGIAYLGASCAVVVTGCRIESCGADQGGGLFAAGGASVDLRETDVLDNNAFGLDLGLCGGGVRCSNATFVARGCSFIGNYAYWDAGGLSLQAVTADVSWCEFTGNGTWGSVSGIELTGGFLAISNSTISGNTLEWWHSGLLSWPGPEGEAAGEARRFLARSCTFDTLYVGMGAIVGENAGTSTVENCSLTACSEIGVYALAEHLVLLNTIVGESALASIFEEYGGTVTASYCCVHGGWPGEGNIAADPLLLADGDLHPRSPCVGAGTNQAWMVGALDLGGLPRLFPSTGRVDIGAYECQDADADGLPDWWEISVLGALSNSPMVRIEHLLPHEDLDGDGYTNAQECENRSDPASASSIPRIVEFAQTSQDIPESTSDVPVSVPARLSTPADATVHVLVYVEGGSATPGSDYAFTNATLSFAAGCTNATVSLTVRAVEGGASREAQEYVRLRLQRVSGPAATGLRCRHVVNIRDSQVDADSDGLPDWWELQYFGSPTAANPAADGDGDSWSNLAEYLRGGNPLNASRPDTNGILGMRLLTPVRSP